MGIKAQRVADNNRDGGDPLRGNPKGGLLANDGARRPCPGLVYKLRLPNAGRRVVAWQGGCHEHSNSRCARTGILASHAGGGAWSRGSCGCGDSLASISSARDLDVLSFGLTGSHGLLT